MTSHHRLLVEPPPRRWPAWVTSALGVATVTVVAVWGAPALGGQLPDGVRLTGVVASTVAPSASAVSAAPVTVTVTAPVPPVEVAPPTARVHYGDFVGDCVLSDPLTPIYLCPTGKG